MHQNKPIAVLTVKDVESIIAYAIGHDKPQIRSGFYSHYGDFLHLLTPLIQSPFKQIFISSFEA